jgi:hypothetical protein
MSIGVFDRKECPPKRAEILAAVGPAIDLWNELNRWMRESFSAEDDLKYMYGKKYGWALRFQRRSALLCALYPTLNGFTAQVILSRAALDEAGLLKLGKNAKQAIEQAHLYAEGKWLFIPVASRRDLDDVKLLFTLKVEPGKKASIKTQRGSAPIR